VFEEYRYDALGRRVLVHAQRTCQDCGQYAQGEGNLDLIRRTVWSGDQELWEIQMPGDPALGYVENDTAQVRMGMTEDYLDVNPFFGRLAYTYGMGTDRPLSITRVRYASHPYGGSFTAWAPFTVVPLWNAQGTPDLGYFGQSGLAQCSPERTTDCILLDWPRDGRIYGSADHLWGVFHGTLIQNKADKAGTFYRRNRYYDPASGRFTQEDPIGLAGGLNLYGYAAGDPVSYSDPYGLKPDTLRGFNDAGAGALGGLALVATLASESSDNEVAAAGRGVLNVLEKLHSNPTKILLEVTDRGRSGTGPLDDGSGEGIRVSHGQDPHVNIAVKIGHELGHSYARVIFGLKDVKGISQRRIQNQTSLRVENWVRTIYGAGCGQRRNHGEDPPAC
jgi:RHS repeat-associated protein